MHLKDHTEAGGQKAADGGAVGGHEVFLRDITPLRLIRKLPS